MLKTDKEFLDYLSKYHTKTIEPNQMVTQQNDTPSSCYILLEGTIRVFTIDINGNESNISFLQRYSVFPLGYAMGKIETSMFFHSASTKAKVAVIPLMEFREEIAKSGILRNYLFDGIVTRYVGSLLHIHALEQSKAQEKIIWYLHYLVLRFGKIRSENNWKIDININQQDMANMLGLTRETITIELNRLKKLDVISYRSKAYTVNMDQLNKYLDSAKWNDIVID